MEQTEVISNERAMVVRRFENYETDFYWACFHEMSRLEQETGLPWRNGFETTIFRVTVGLLYKEKQPPKSLDEVASALRWMWNLLSLGAWLMDTSPMRAARTFVLPVRSRVYARLSMSEGMVVDLDQLLAEEMAAGWKPLFMRMREVEQGMQEEIAVTFNEIRRHPFFTCASLKEKPGILVQLPYGESELGRTKISQFFRPQTALDPSSMENMYDDFEKVRENGKLARVWMQLPVRHAGLPTVDPVGFGNRPDIKIEDHWIRTQLLFAAVKADIDQETAPWELEELLQQVPPKMKAETIVRAFWKRMEARWKKGEGLSIADRALLEPRLLMVAKGSILHDTRLVRRGKELRENDRTLYLVAPPGKMSLRQDVKTGKKWVEVFVNGGDSQTVKDALVSLEALSTDERMNLVWHAEKPTRGEGFAYLLNTHQKHAERLLPIVAPVVLRGFCQAERIWESEVLEALHSMVLYWISSGLQEGKAAVMVLRDIHACLPSFLLLHRTWGEIVLEERVVLFRKQAPFLEQVFHLWLNVHQELESKMEELNLLKVNSQALDAYRREILAWNACALFYAAPKAERALPSGWYAQAKKFFERLSKSFSLPLLPHDEGSSEGQFLAHVKRFAEEAAAHTKKRT